jgi:hypothetical protein
MTDGNRPRRQVNLSQASEFIEIVFPADQITGNEQAAYAQSNWNANWLKI